MDYPKDFSIQAQARIEAAKIRAGQVFAAATKEARYAADVEPLFYQYIMTVFAQFAHEACALGLDHVWTAARIEKEVLEFLRVFTIYARSERGFSRSGTPIRPTHANTGGGLLREVERVFRQSPEWEKYEQERLVVADAQAGAAPIQAALARAQRPPSAPVPEETISSQLKELKEQSRLTIEEIAQKMRLDTRSVERHLSGKMQPRTAHIGAYERVFAEAIGTKVLIRRTPVKRR